MALLEELEPGDTIDFSLYAAVDGLRRMTGILVGVMSHLGLPSYNTASTDHVNIYRELPEANQLSVADDWTSYKYIALLTPDDKTHYIGIPWMVEASLARNVTKLCEVKIRPFNDANAEGVLKVLRLNGYTVESHRIYEV